MIAAFSNSGRRIGRRHTASDERLEDSEQALRPPVTDPRENGVGVFMIGFDPQRFQITIDERSRSCDTIDDIKFDSEIDRRLGKSSVCTKIWTGAQEQKTHSPMVAQPAPNLLREFDACPSK